MLTLLLILPLSPVARVVHFLRLMAVIAWECYLHPFTTSVIDFKTLSVERLPKGERRGLR